MPAKALGLPAAPTIGRRCGFAYPGPNIKPTAGGSAFARRAPAIKGDQGESASPLTAGMSTPGISRRSRRRPDFVAVAERFRSSYPGAAHVAESVFRLVDRVGRSRRQRARDSDMMETTPAPVVFDDALRDLRRGDLVFWKGHIGIMRDAESCCTPTAGT